MKKEKLAGGQEATALTGLGAPKPILSASTAHAEITLLLLTRNPGAHTPTETAWHGFNLNQVEFLD